MIRLANTPMPHVTSVAHSVLDLIRIKGLLHTMPISEQKTGDVPGNQCVKNGAAASSQPEINSQDWDVMFLAVTVRLENCVNQTKIQRLVDQVPGSAQTLQNTVLECVSALNLLHASFTCKRKNHDHSM